MHGHAQSSDVNNAVLKRLLGRISLIHFHRCTSNKDRSCVGRLLQTHVACHATCIPIDTNRAHKSACRPLWLECSIRARNVLRQKHGKHVLEVEVRGKKRQREISSRFSLRWGEGEETLWVTCHLHACRRGNIRRRLNANMTVKMIPAKPGGTFFYQ